MYFNDKKKKIIWKRVNNYEEIFKENINIPCSKNIW